MQSSNNQNPTEKAGFIEKAIDHLTNFEKSEFIQKTNHMMEKGHQVMDKIDAEYQIAPMTIEQLLNNFSPVIDEKIIQHVKSTQETPVGGEIKFSLKSDNEILAIWDFYFTDKNNKYKKISSEKIIAKSSVTDDAYQHIKGNSPTFNIDPPKMSS